MRIIGATDKQCSAIEMFAKILGIDNFKVKVVNNTTETYCVQHDEFVFHIYMEDEEDIESLAHEMVHVKQYVNKELIELLYGKVMYKGVVYDDSSSEDYWDFPWEVEAYGKQKGLYHKWRDTQRSDLTESYGNIPLTQVTTQ